MFQCGTLVASGRCEVAVTARIRWVRKGDVRNCCCYRAVMLLEYGVKVVELVLEKRLCRIVSVD